MKNFNLTTGGIGKAQAEEPQGRPGATMSRLREGIRHRWAGRYCLKGDGTVKQVVDIAVRMCEGRYTLNFIRPWVYWFTLKFPLKPIITQLNRHMPTHSERPRELKCSFCLKAFFRRDVLKAHERAHKTAAGRMRCDTLETITISATVAFQSFYYSPCWIYN